MVVPSSQDESEIKYSNGTKKYAHESGEASEEAAPMYKPDGSCEDKCGEHKSSGKTLHTVPRYIYAMLAFAVTVAVISTGLTIYIYTNPKHTNLLEPTETAETTFRNPVCLQCVKLVKTPLHYLEEDPLTDKLLKRLDDGIEMCCAENEEQMSVLVEAMTRVQETRPVPDLDRANTDLNMVPVSAHKQLLPGDDRELTVTEPYYGGATDHFVVRFNSKYNDPLTEHANGVTVLDEALQIRYSGVYYVYLSVNIAPRFHHNSAETFQDWGFSVHRTRPNSPATSGVLLQLSHTPCSDCRQHQETAFAGGSFTLKENDLLQVCISGLGLVQYSKESSFLGLTLLSNNAAEKQIMSR